MSNNGIVTIKGKEYMTVARRIKLAHENKMLESIETEVLSHDPVVIRARVMVKGKVFTGISAVNNDTAKYIEQITPHSSLAANRSGGLPSQFKETRVGKSLVKLP